MTGTRPICTLTALTAVSISLFAATASAQPGDLLQSLDTDGNGAISRAEAEGAAAARFAAMDVDGNGSLSQDELVAAAQSRAAERATELFARLDADGDGEVSAAEMPGLRGDRLGRMFERLDADENGELSPEEIADMRRGGHRGVRGDGGQKG